METEQQKQLRLIKEQATIIREGHITLQTLVDDDEEIQGHNWITQVPTDKRFRKHYNQFLARLRQLKECIFVCHQHDDMYTMCPVKPEYTIDEILSDLEECINHCTDDVNYNPPKYYLKLCNQLYKYYSKYEKSL